MEKTTCYLYGFCVRPQNFGRYGFLRLREPMQSLCGVASLWQGNDFCQEMQRLQPFSRPSCTDGGGWQGLMKDKRNKHTMMCHVKDVAALLWQDIRRFTSKSIAWIVRTQRFYVEKSPRILEKSPSNQGANGSASHTSCKQRDALQQERIFSCKHYLACIVKSCCTPGPEILVLFVASGLNAWLMLYKACILQSLLGGVQCPHIHVAFEHFPLMVRLFPGWVSLDPDHCSSQHFTTSRHGWCVNSWRVRIWVVGESSSLSWLLLFPTASSKRALLHRGGLKLWPSSPLQFWPVHYSLRPPNMCRRQSQRTKLIWHEVVVLEHGSQKGLDIWNKV